MCVPFFFLSLSSSPYSRGYLNYIYMYIITSPTHAYYDDDESRVQMGVYTLLCSAGLNAFPGWARKKNSLSLSLHTLYIRETFSLSEKQKKNRKRKKKLVFLSLRRNPTGHMSRSSSNRWTPSTWCARHLPVLLSLSNKIYRSHLYFSQHNSSSSQYWHTIYSYLKYRWMRK